MTQKQTPTSSFIRSIGKICCLLMFAGFNSLSFLNFEAAAAIAQTLARSEPLDSRTFRKPSNERLEQQQQQLRERQQQFRQQYQREWNQQQQQWKNKQNRQQQETREYRMQNQERTYQRLELQRQERLERQREPLLIQPIIQPR